MKLARVLSDDGPCFARIDDGAVRVMTTVAPGTELWGVVRTALEAGAALPLSAPQRVEQVRLLAPVTRPRKIVAVGLNYRDHIAESKLETPREPVVFAKFPSSIIGPDEPIRWRQALTDGVDYEAELAVIIGVEARNVSPDEALDHVLGYTCLNDVSARDLQFADGQWDRSKSLDTFCPIGPWLVTADEIPDPQALPIRAIVSGEELQNSSTANMLFGVAELIAHLSRSFTLDPGDVIATGTPGGVGWHRKPRRTLRQGDVVQIQIDGIGVLRNPVLVDP